MMYGWDYMGGYGILGFVFSLLMMALLVVGIALAIRYFGHTTNVHANESAVDILKKRYARGEISKDEFTRMKKEIQ